MKSLKFVFVVFIGIVLSFSVFAENVEKKPVPYDAFYKAIGIYSGIFADDALFGLQFQQWGENFGWQGFLSLFYDPKGNYDGSILDYSIIIDGLYNLYGDTFSDIIAGRLYIWGSLGHRGYILEETNWIDSRTTTTEAYNVLVGLGFGIEIISFGHFSLPIQFGYYGTFPTNPKVSFSVSSGFRYRF